MSEPHRRARPATAARRSARGSSDQSSGSCTLTASSTIPSRSAQSLVTISSMPKTSKIVASRVTPAGSSSARFSSMPGSRRRSAADMRTMRRCSARSWSRFDPQAVRAGGDLAVVVRGGQPGEVVDRAARADRHPRLAAANLVDDRRELVADPRSRARSRSPRDGGSDCTSSRGEPADAEGHARGPAQAGGVADHDLDAAAADVDAQRRRGLEHQAGPDRGEDQAGLLEPADHLDLDAGLGLDAVDELAAVRRGADRARGLRDHLLRAERVGELAQAPHGSRPPGRPTTG